MPKEKRAVTQFSLYHSLILPLMIILTTIGITYSFDLSTLEKNIIKIIFLIPCMIYASYNDIKTKEIPHIAWIGILLVGLINVTLDSLIGLSLAFLPLFLVAMITNFGGGDVKYAAVCGFVIGGVHSLLGILLALILSLIVEMTVNAIKGFDLRRQFPFGPYLSIGFFVTGIYKFFIV